MVERDWEDQWDGLGSQHRAHGSLLCCGIGGIIGRHCCWGADTQESENH